MKIWLAEIGEPLPLEAGKRLLRYGCFSSWLAGRGHEVAWFASDFSHAVKSHVCEVGTYTTDDGVRLIVQHGPGYKKNVGFGRMWHHARMAMQLSAAMEAEAKANGLPDVIINPIPTIENAFVIARFAKKYPIAVQLDVRDNWPDDFVNRLPRVLRPIGKIVFGPLFVMGRYAAAQANSITGVSAKQRAHGLKLARRGLDTSRDPVFYLGYTRQEIAPQAHTQAMQWWHNAGLRQDAKIFAFAGTLGISFDFAPIIAAAKRLKAAGRDDIQFVIAGDGDARAHWIEAAGELAGKSILFPGWIDMPRIDALLRQSYAALAPYIPNTSMSLPNKFFEYMAYGLPVLSACTGESQELMASHDYGMQYDPTDLDAFYECVCTLTDQPALQHSKAQNAKGLFESHFKQSELFTKMEAHFKTLAGQK